MAVPAIGPPAATHGGRLCGRRRRRRSRRRLEPGRRDRGGRTAASRQRRADRLPPRGLRLQPRRLVRRSGDGQSGRVSRPVRAGRDGRRACGSHVGGRARRAASPTASGRRPTAAARSRTCRRASPSSSTCDCSMFVALGDGAGGHRRRPDDGARSGPRTASSRTARRPSRLRSSRAASARTPPSGGYRPGDIIFFGHGAGGDGPRRALARRRPDRPVLVERRRLEHPTARRLRRADRLGAVDERRHG